MTDTNGSGGFITTRLSVMMFLQFFVWGAWFVTMGPLMNSLDMDPKIIGWAYSTAPIAAILSPFILGLLADRFINSERMLGILHVLGGAALFAAPAALQQGTAPFLAVVFLHTLFYMPTLGVSNTVAFHQIKNPERQFPIIRVWGTVGWIVANWVISKSKLDVDPQMFYVAGGAGVALGVYSFFLPRTPPPAKGKPFQIADALGFDALALLRSPPFLVFTVCSFLICIPLAAYYGFAGTYVGATGFKEIGSTMSYGQMSEILFMLAMPLFFARLGVKWMLLIGMLAWVLRYGLFAGAADDSVKWMVLGGIVLHGICYDFFFVTGQIYVDQKADPKIRGQAQGFLVLITQGLGMLVGQQVFSRLVAQNTTDGVVDWKTTWMIPCIFAGLISLAFFAFFHEKRHSDTPADA